MRVGVASSVLAGIAVAIDPSALAVVPVLAALFVVRFRHGARWPLAVPAVGCLAWALAMAPVWWGSDTEVLVGARAQSDLLDALGGIAPVAALAGVIAVWRRRSTRWTGMVLIAVLLGGIAGGRFPTGGDGAGLVVGGGALVAGIGISRFARLAGPPVGQVFLGGATAFIVVLPAVLFAIS